MNKDKIKDYFDKYFEEHKEIIDLDELNNLVERERSKNKILDREISIFFDVAKKAYTEKVVFPLIESILNESEQPMSCSEIFEQIPKLRAYESSLRTSWVYYARKLDNDVVIIIENNNNKNKYKYDTECAKVQRKDRTKVKRYCGEYRCDTEDCLKYEDSV